MDKQKNPKLELKLNDVVRLKLLKDKCFEGKSSYGPFYLYTVSHDGVEKSFFAPVEIHEQIQKNGLRKDSEFILRNVSGQNGKRLTGELAIELVSEAAPTSGSADNFKQIMQQSLQDAIDITKSVNTIPFQNEDIRALSSCLFIARTKGL